MFRNRHILITSGPTRMPLDAMRFISNRSTGRFGTLLAREALGKGAWVTFVYGKGSETPKPHRRLELIEVESNPQVVGVLKSQLKKFPFDALIHAMALLDFEPWQIRKGKTKTKNGTWRLELIPTPKIINQIKKWGPKVLLIGFKLEAGVSQKALLKQARHLLHQAKADFVLANQLTEGDDKKHAGVLLDKKGDVVAKAVGKKKLARQIIKRLEREWK